LFASSSKAGHADKKLVQLACYILDGTLESYKLNQYLPSQLAAGAIFIARRTVGLNPWRPTLLRFAVYREEEVAIVARDTLSEKHSLAADVSAVNKKYSSSRFGSVASIALITDF
jgi:hypothetical protein